MRAKETRPGLLRTTLQQLNAVKVACGDELAVPPLKRIAPEKVRRLDVQSKRSCNVQLADWAGCFDAPTVTLLSLRLA